MTDHKYVFQGPVGQMQLSHCTVYVQGIVEKLTLEDCQVQVSGIVQQRFDMNKRVFVVDPPKPANDYEVRELRREVNELRWKLRNSQTHEEQLRNKIKELKESGTVKEFEPSDDVLVQRICSLRDTLDKERDEHAKEVAELKDRLDVACEINAKLRHSYEDDYRKSQEIADKHIDILATLMAAYPFTPTDDLSFEIGLPVHRIRYVADAFRVMKSKEKREEARDYLKRQSIELIERRGGDQGNYAGARPVEKVGKYGRLIKSYNTIKEAATDNGLCEDTIKGHCIRYHKAKKYFTKEGFTFRFKKQ